MKLSSAVASITLSALSFPSPSIEAFARPSFSVSRPRIPPGHRDIPRRSIPRRCRPTAAAIHAAASTGTSDPTSTRAEIRIVPTVPIPDMRPGTSGLRKKVEVWQGPHYLENFVQSLIETAAEKEGETLQTIIVAGDGRYHNSRAIPVIAHLAAANGIRNIWIPRFGIMSTPAVSAAIRRRRPNDDEDDGSAGGGKDGEGIAQGGIVLTASHNPGGPGEDFGIKYNEGLGQPAGEDFTEALYQKTLSISNYKTLSNLVDIDISAPVGTKYALTPTSTVTIIDPYRNYVEALKSCFDFDRLREFGKHQGFSILFDGMHGAGGIFAKRVLVEELGLPESSLMRCNPLPDFGKCHPDPNLTYASELVQKMGLLPDGSADPSVHPSSLPTLGAANDGDGDRNLIAGAGFFVTPSDSLALLCDNWESIPQFASRGGLKGVARSMPSSAALDVVAAARNIPCFVTPTGWKFFGNLMSSKEMFGGEDYTPFLCGEESFGTGSDHVREKDGLWAVLAWMSILAEANEGNVGEEGTLVGVKDIVQKHWEKYGRHFYCRYDYEGVDSSAANKVMDFIRENFVNADASSMEIGESGIKLTTAVEFSYTDPVDGSKTSKQGLILNFDLPSGDPARVVFRLSGTGSAGATIRMYLEQYEKDSSKHGMSAPAALRELAEEALRLVKMEETTGRDAPTVIT